MKKSSKIVVAGLLGLSAAGIANAQDVILLTGSTAYRGATVTAVTNLLQPGFTCAYDNGTFTKANHHIFTGSFTNSGVLTPVIIKCTWTGSAGGVQTVSQQLPITGFLTNSTVQSVLPGSTQSSGSDVFDTPEVPDIGMEDGAQSITLWPTPVLHGTTVGTVDFVFVAQSGAPAGLTNMTPLLAQELWLLGSMPVSLFDGNSADFANTVFATGRDPDSGTRQTALQETGIGNLTQIIQYAPTNSTGGIVGISGSATAVGQEIWPDDQINGIDFGSGGDGGYNSGGNLATAMLNNNVSAQGGAYVTYLGLSDAKTATGGAYNAPVPGDATYMTYNGIPYSPTAVQQGQYSFWTYEHVNYRQNYGTVDAIGKAFADQLASRILNFDATAAGAGEFLSSMLVTRSIEGGVISHK